jgi:hypothetical protein
MNPVGVRAKRGRTLPRYCLGMSVCMRFERGRVVRFVFVCSVRGGLCACALNRSMIWYAYGGRAPCANGKRLLRSGLWLVGAQGVENYRGGNHTVGSRYLGCGDCVRGVSCNMTITSLGLQSKPVRVWHLAAHSYHCI